MADDVFVRVAVRIRPLLAKEVLHRHRVCVRVVPGSSQVMLGSDRLFSFEHAFGPESSQDQVYEACVRPLLDALLEGYNATVFCYGQTGSGKTYTLEGGSLAEEGGVIDRVAHDLFYLLDQSSEVVKYTVSMSYLELYKEELRDLLELPTVHKALHIREDDKGNTVVAGATETAISSAEELLSVLETGNALRHTGSTAMNEQSSRSHAILSLHLHQRIHSVGSSHQTARSSKLCLVDLAGSERAYKTGNTGQRLKESAHINTGLLALGNVIRALTDPSRNRNTVHVPYRDAKITRLLRDSLGGQAHTLMMACVSPSDQSVAETMSVLQFASKARHIRNRPVSAASSNAATTIPWDPGEAKIRELEFEVQTLRELLKEKQNELQKERDRTKDGESSQVTLNRADLNVTQDMWEYFELAEEASALLAEVLPSVADSYFNRRVVQWQERFCVINKIHQTAQHDKAERNKEQQSSDGGTKLKEELSQCKEALAIDEEILQQKEADLKLLKDKTEKLNQECKAHLQELETEREQNRIKSEQLVNQLIMIERLQGFKSTALGDRESSACGSCERRAQSVPLPRHSCTLRPLRKIHSSPPIFSLERVMASFKMRGQLLLAELDEKQEVYCPVMEKHKTPDANMEEDDYEEESFLSKMGFSHSLNRTWTSRLKTLPERSFGLKQEPDEPFQSCQGSNELQQDLHTKPSQPNKMRSSLTRRRIQELTINMKMKEKLIKELEETDKLSQAADREGSRSAGVLGRISKQSQRARTEVYYSLQHMRKQRAALQASCARERPQALPGQCEVQLSANGKQYEEDPLEQTGDRDWLEELEEQVLKRRAQLRDLTEEQRSREQVQQRRQACLQQKNKLEIKRLRSSQVLNQDLLRVSVQLDNLEEQIQSERGAKGVSIEELKHERDALQKKRDALEAQLKDNQVLTPEEEHCLLELEEALETLDAAVEFKNKNIQKKQEKLSASGLPSHELSASEATHLSGVLSKLKELSPPEMSELFTRYFSKVVRLREVERSLRWRCEELELQTAEQDMALRETEGNMQRLALDTDRRLMQQHREHQANVQLLLSQLKEIASKEEQHDIQDRLQHLEKELFFYKSSSRQLKKQLRELSASQASANQLINSQRDEHTGTNGTPSYEQVQASAHIPTKYTRINATATPHSQTGSFIQQKVSPVSSFHLQSDQKTSLCNSLFLNQSNESSQSNPFGEKLTPVRVRRRGLRQISPSRLQISQSSTKGYQSTVETSTDTTMLEDSIEVTRNAHR